ncbi:tail protein X [Caulobacter sp. RL271]|uniref:Tail protein X n=1 Tax=Caulobacter segnis TaxID=88688 RepID=A0ABY4ZX71_9CAUL|nr:tail protein X [Caulobacter segnis]USQ97234.1 tail protein X [Caulobacter segnis]
MSEVVRVDIEGLTLSRFLWRRYRKPTPGLAEAVLDANPGLADVGPVLPLGRLITIPTVATKTVEVVQLWD